jgi:type I restriction enzyme S subunit
MKQSGIEWLGQIPTHWNAMPLKHAVLDVIDCKNRTPEYAEGGEYGVVRTTNVKSGAFVAEDLLWTNEREFRVWTQRGVPQPGDVLFTREAPAGEACIVPVSPSICLGQRMMLFRIGRYLVDSDFVLFSVYGPQVQEFIAANTQGSTVHHLRVDQVRNLPFLVPPPEEQTRIGTFLRGICGRVDRVVASIKAHIGKLREYRQALIIAAVTGKIDVFKEAG